MKNICCRIFKEQIDLINQLPEQERATVLYTAINNAFNQFDNQNENQIDNQIENQNENAYVSVSVSVSVLGNSIINLLSKNIICKEFSTNYGGRRIGAGKKPAQQKTAAKDYTAVNEEGFENTVPVKEQDNSIQTTSSSQEEYKEPWERQPEPFDPKKKEDADALLAVMTGMMSTKAGDVLVKPEGHIGWKDATLKEFCTERYPEEVRKKVLAWIAWNKTAGQTFKAQNFIKLMAKFAGRNPNEEMAAFMVFNESKTNRSRAV